MDRKKIAKAPRRPMLDKPGIALPETGPGSSFCFYAVVLSLAGAAAMGCFFTAFQIPVDLLSVLLRGVICALLCSAQFHLGRWKWLAALVLFAIWGVDLWWNFEDAVQGCFRTINWVLAAYGEKLTLSLPSIHTTFAGNVKARKLFTLFAAILQFPFYELLSWLFIRHKSALGAFCLTGVFLLFPLAISILPEAWALGLLLLFWTFLLFAAPALRQRRQLVDGKGRFQAIGNVFPQPAALLLLPVLGLCIFAVYRAYPPETYERPRFVNNIQAELTEGISLPALLRGDTGSGGDRINLSSLGSRSYTGKTALRVKYEWQDPLITRSDSPTAQKDYLKSFVGGVYTGTSWERLSQKDAAAAQKALGEFHSQTLPADLSQAYYFNEDIHSAYLLSVEKTDVDTRGVYSPYGLYAPAGAPEGMEYVDDGCLRSTGPASGSRKYTLSGVALPSYGVPMVSRFEFAAFNRQSAIFDEDNDTVVFSSSADADFIDRFNKERDQYLSDHQEPSAADLWTIPDWAKETFTDTDWSLLEATERYTAFVFEHYTQLPGSTREFLEDYMERNGLLRWNTDFPYSGDVEECGEMLQSIREFLAGRCSYTLSPSALPQGKDFVEYFLEESQEGFCVHFASAAVAMLRMLGVPARYAEGYAVPVSEDGEWVNVPDYNAHAWVEIYWSGTGWLPVEMTPSGPEAPAAYANAAAPEEGGVPSQKPSASPMPEPAESSPAPSASPSPIPTPSSSPVKGSPSLAPSPGAAGTEGSAGEKGEGVLTFRFLLALLAVPLLLFLLWAQRAVRVHYRQRSFRQRDRNQAALRVYAHLLRLYREMAVLSEEKGPPEEAEKLALKARFSNHTLTKKELQDLIKLAEALEKRLGEELPKLARLRCKYLLALF